MRRSWPIFFMLFAAVVVWLALLSTPLPLSVVMIAPFRAMLGSQRELHARLLWVTESVEPVRAAGQRLLQPLGVVRLVRTFSLKEEDGSTPAPPANPENPPDSFAPSAP
jgi:hypothetical protein